MIDPFVATVITLFVPVATEFGIALVASQLLVDRGYRSGDAEAYGVGLGLLLGASLFAGLAFGFSWVHEAGKQASAEVAAPAAGSGEGES